MKLLIIGAGGVGTSAAKIIKRAGEGGMWAEKVVISDYNEARAKQVSEECDDERFVYEKIDASDSKNIKDIIKKHGITFVMNAVEP
ncbi:saccharopine dehydrogenase NADP-binding domain-containing protein, partial [Anaerovorax odorimutans]|uniref:saccharopine dehydrogenase NADP-binding domain-containing protein n=1 Tax=Anaerovorax odorimutans TaxID=109327 RepID=UPI00055D1CA0